MNYNFMAPESVDAYELSDVGCDGFVAMTNVMFLGMKKKREHRAKAVLFHTRSALYFVNITVSP